MSNEKPSQKSTEVKAEPAVDAQMAAVMKGIAEQIIPAAVAAAVSAMGKQQASARASQAQPVRSPTCHECGQSVSACEGKHVKMVVMPQRYQEYFPGAIINGVRYLSNDLSHEVLVPEAAVGGITHAVHVFETNEREIETGRVAEKQSGRVSPYGSSTINQTVAWR